MGCGRGFTFILGSLFGVYVAQHYRVPRIRDWVHSGCDKARELEQAYRRPDDFNHWARDCWMRPKYHERNYHRPENFYGNKAGEEQNNEVVHPSLSQPTDLNRFNTFDTKEAREEPYNYKVVHQDRVRPMDPNEVREKQNKNNLAHPRWVRPRDPISRPYNNNGPEKFNPNEHGQE